jgi:hypothetical protein
MDVVFHCAPVICTLVPYVTLTGADADFTVRISSAYRRSIGRR